jgi:hypothetical protein
MLWLAQTNMVGNGGRQWQQQQRCMLGKVRLQGCYVVFKKQHHCVLSNTLFGNGCRCRCCCGGGGWLVQVLQEDIKPSLQVLRAKCADYERWAGLESTKARIEKLLVAYDHWKCTR